MILARYEAKIAKICILWTLRPITAQNVQKLQIIAIFTSYLASILNKDHIWPFVSP